ncbi:MAG: hypothetical protein ABR522_12825, partial [Marinobacter sp.]
AERGLLTTPESGQPIPVIAEACSGSSLLPANPGLSNVQQAVLSPSMNALHRQLARSRPEWTTAAILRHCLEHGPEQLMDWQLSLLFRDRQALTRLHQLAWQAGQHNYWGQRIAALIPDPRRSTGERVETTDPHHAAAERPVCGTAAAALSLDTVDCS